MYLLGLDIGSSSVKATIVEGDNGKTLASAFYPKQEMDITAKKAGWAEQDPEMWYKNMKLAIREVLHGSGIVNKDIKAIGISYQMHGLILIGKNKEVLRPSIIWCDSRAVEIGNKAFEDIGVKKCLTNLLNSPGNFTASKLKWVKDHEPDIFKKIYKIMLPGDYIAMKLTDRISTTISGLSEGILWDFVNNEYSGDLLNYYGFTKDIIPEILPTFSEQGELTKKAADDLGLYPGTKVTYRAGDQPNNAFSLNVLNPGEIAATAGTSGVVYGVSDEIKYDPQSRVNTFAHVNHTAALNRLGILLCINGTGIQYSWIKKNLGFQNTSYDDLNTLASKVSIGSDGLITMPFGNGSERMLHNKNVESSLHNLNFNIHTASHIIRAAQEGIAFSFKYGIDIMHEVGLNPSVIRAGNANLFLSKIFRNTLASITGATIEIYDTDGSAGAAKAAGIGSGYYKSFEQVFELFVKLDVIQPDYVNEAKYKNAYIKWKEILNKILNQ